MRIYNIMTLVMLTSCALGPDYKKPEMPIPNEFKNAPIEWKLASPGDEIERKDWWKIYEDPILDELEQKLNKHNENIKSAQNSYQESLVIIDKTRVSYLPSIGASSAITRQNTKTSSKSWGLDASWEPDLWGNISRELESSIALAGVSKANLASVRLSSQASLAQYYFELRMADKDQNILDDIVASYQEILDYTNNRYLLGVASDQDLTLAKQQLQTAKITSISNNTTRTQYQHAIAILIGESPSSFNLDSTPNISYRDVSIPVAIPSSILERRPDIASAQRQVAIASANIGIAKSAFFPSFSMSANKSSTGNLKGDLLSFPASIWSFGPQIALNLTNIAAYKASVIAANENYNASVASYRNTVLSAFGDVEDNLIALNNLKEQAKSQAESTDHARKLFEISQNQYKSGIIDKAGLLTSMISYYNMQKNLNDIEGLKATSSVALIKSLGGGWL